MGLWCAAARQDGKPHSGAGGVVCSCGYATAAPAGGGGGEKAVMFFSRHHQNPLGVDLDYELGVSGGSPNGCLLVDLWVALAAWRRQV